MTPKGSCKLAGFSAGLLLLTSSSWAIESAMLPGSVLPDQVSKSLSEQPQMPAVSRPEVKHALPPNSVLGPEAKKIKFTLNGIVLEGNRVYSSSRLAVLYKNKIHKQISVSDLFDIVQDITNYYRNNGYIVTRAILPPQHVKNGVVHVRIVEGFADKAAVVGHPHGAKCLVQAYGKEIIKCRPIRLERMEKYLLIANTIPGTQVKAVLTPSKKTLGAAELNLLTENQPLTGYVSYDNYGTRYIGPQQITANIGFNSFISSGDSTQVTVTKTPRGGELTYADLNYNMALGSRGLRWLFGATRVHTHPLYVLKPTQIDGLNNNYYTNLQYPAIQSRSENLILQAGLNYLDSEVTSLDMPLYNDHVRTLDLSATYNFADRWYGTNFATFDFRQGLPILGYTSNTDPSTAQTSRAGGRGDYTKFNIQTSRLQSVYGPFSVYGLMRGQWAFNPVLSSEQFSFGGPQFGRAYDVAEIIGDKGLGGTLEIHYDWNIARFLIQSMQLYTFYDFAKIWNFKSISGTPTMQSATSTGVGSRFYMSKYVSGNLMWTQQLTKPVAAQQLIGDGYRPRVFFSIVVALD